MDGFHFSRKVTQWLQRNCLIDSTKRSRIHIWGEKIVFNLSKWNWQTQRTTKCRWKKYSDKICTKNVLKYFSIAFICVCYSSNSFITIKFKCAANWLQQTFLWVVSCRWRVFFRLSAGKRYILNGWLKTIFIVVVSVAFVWRSMPMPFGPLHTQLCGARVRLHRGVLGWSIRTLVIYTFNVISIYRGRFCSQLCVCRYKSLVNTIFHMICCKSNMHFCICSFVLLSFHTFCVLAFFSILRARTRTHAHSSWTTKNNWDTKKKKKTQIVPTNTFSHLFARIIRFVSFRLLLCYYWIFGQRVFNSHMNICASIERMWIIHFFYFSYRCTLDRKFCVRNHNTFIPRWSGAIARGDGAENIWRTVEGILNVNLKWSGQRGRRWAMQQYCFLIRICASMRRISAFHIVAAKFFSRAGGSAGGASANNCLFSAIWISFEFFQCEVLRHQNQIRIFILFICSAQKLHMHTGEAAYSVRGHSPVVPSLPLHHPLFECRVSLRKVFTKSNSIVCLFAFYLALFDHVQRSSGWNEFIMVDLRLNGQYVRDAIFHARSRTTSTATPTAKKKN